MARSALACYGVAVLSVAAALALAAALVRSGQGAGQVFLAAVMVSAWYGGFGPGLLAVGLAASALDWLLPPAYALDTSQANVLRLGVFLLVALLISSLTAVRARLERELREEHCRKDEFLAVLAHELRNPLGTVLNAVRLMRLSKPDPTVVERAGEVIERQARHMNRLINELLDISRIRQGKLELCRERVDLAAVVHDAVEATRFLIEEKGQSLEISLPTREILLEADPTRLEQVLVNLLTNASKFTPSGGHIWVGARQEAGEAILSVTDDGPGIPFNLLPRIFELHVQATNGSYGGLGIGLSLVRSLVQMHGGSVKAFSQGPGRGTEFLVRLPALAHQLTSAATAG